MVFHQKNGYQTIYVPEADILSPGARGPGLVTRPDRPSECPGVLVQNSKPIDTGGVSNPYQITAPYCGGLF